jgi:hypothetical protein
VIGFRAILLCDAARVEPDGSLSLAHVYNDRLFAPPGDGPITVAAFVVAAIARGLRGAERVGFRHHLRAHDVPQEPPPFAYHDHDPLSDEHNFLFEHEHVVFSSTGVYVLELELATADLAITELFAFTVERR